jgi:hypothetical protein
MERTLLWLRPIVGATAALALYFAQLSKLVTIGPMEEQSSATYFFVAFCAGFSEQFFLKHLNAVLQPKKRRNARELQLIEQCRSFQGLP